MTESATGPALRRAASRAAFHLLRAAVEGLKALEVFVDELAAIGRNESGGPDEAPGRERIDIE